MGSFTSGSKGREKKVKSALQPVSFTSPFGSVSTSKKGAVSFTPDSQMMGIFRNAGDRINSTMGQLPTSFSINDMYNNPFYDNTANLLQAPIDRQFRQQQSELTNTLNARNQMGSSYDALMNNYLNQNYDYNTNQARMQARQASADAYNQNNTNLLNTLNTLGGVQTNQTNMMYQPLQMALGYQQAMTPLQSAMAGYYANQPTMFENLMKWNDSMSRNLSSMAQAL